MWFEIPGSYISDESICEYIEKTGNSGAAENMRVSLESLAELLDSTKSFFDCIEGFVNSDPEAVKKIQGTEPFRVSIAMNELPDFPFPFIKMKDKLSLDMTPTMRATVMAALIVASIKLKDN